MFFEAMLQKLKSDTSEQSLISSIINPFSMLFLCDYYLGDEFLKFSIQIPSSCTDLANVKEFSSLPPFTKIFVQVNFFQLFIDSILPNLRHPIILMTGQFFLPQLKRTRITDSLLKNTKIHVWISQNPIYPLSSKYIPFPYGIRHTSLKDYAVIVLESESITKSIELLHLSINHNTNRCRKLLPSGQVYPKEEFYKEIKKAKFMISPIGDRDDCYRHYECIGLETMPISNIGSNYRSIFGDSMIYSPIETMVKNVRENKTNYLYKVPNKDIVCLDYWKKVLEEKILQYKN